MIFKQRVSREEKMKFFCSIIAVLIIPLVILIIGIIKKEDLKLFIFFLLVVGLPILIILILIGLRNLEWFHIYEDKIEARCIFGIKNIVYFKEVLFVQELKINLTARGTARTFFVFNDGRKNNNSYFDFNACYNNKKNNLRIYKTNELVSYILKTLKLKMNVG